MKARLRNWLLQNSRLCFLFKNRESFLLFLFFISISLKSQIANYVNNGSFEICGYCASTPSVANAKYWNSIDTNKYCGVFLGEYIYPYLVPGSSFTNQWPKNGNNYFLSTLVFKPNTPQTTRGYPRNSLKQTLQIGHNYCVKIYYNVTDQSSYGVDGLGAYFGDNSTDTMTQCDKPITYLTPQIQNPNNNFITDTAHWALLTGIFTANGTEKYMMLGNFKSDVTTNSVMINPTNLPLIFCDVIYDDVSVIDIDLPAYTGPDIWGIPTTTVYLGRPQDVGIDEACMWYHLPNNTTAIDTAAGITITVAATTQTYMVKQDICGNIKYDTVVVHPSGVGINELKDINEGVKVYPNPVNEELIIEIENISNEEKFKLKILNNLGQIIREEDIVFKEKSFNIKTSQFENGIYFLSLSNNNLDSINRQFVITR